MTLVGKIRGLDGSLLNGPPKGESVAIEAEMLLNLVARVQNLEACLVMMMTICQKDMSLVNADETDIVMESFFQAQTQRGASHLSRSVSDDNPAIFI